jgi:uncharacterized BrkB/YihY/UPF0761 family membrane protein
MWDSAESNAIIDQRLVSMRIFFAYVAPFLLLLLFVAGVVAQIAVDAHHWMPRKWWLSLLRKK